MRVSCLPLNTGEKIVIRILDYTRSLQGIDNLGFNQSNLKKIKRMMAVPNGIILITGATGSGKSTTVYSMLQGLNKPEINIITVEDPIEMNIEGMNQVQVNAEIGMTFAAALRSILRQDPNVILIGEIRDSETAQIAVRASITGHLVLSTIHTNNSLATIERLLDMDVERYLMSTALTGIVSQRLGKKLCTYCRFERETTKYEKKVFKKFMNRDVDKIYDANHKGCEHCRHGYKGRIAIHEVLELDDEIRNAISNPKLKKEELAEMVYSGKTITMLQDALGKAIAGLTSFEEVYRVIEMETDAEDDVSYLTRSLDEDDETSDKKEELATNTLDDLPDNTKETNITIAEPETTKTNQTETKTNINSDNKTQDIKEIMQKQNIQNPIINNQTSENKQNNEEKTSLQPTQSTQPVQQTPGTLPQVKTLTKEQQEEIKKQQEKAKQQIEQEKAKQTTTTPTMLTAEQAKLQADKAKQEHLKKQENENDKKLNDYILKTNPQEEIKKQKLIINTPNITPTPISKIPTTKPEVVKQQTEKEQETNTKPQVQVLVKPAPPTQPQPEKVEKEIPELKVAIKTDKENINLPASNETPIINEEQNVFDEKNKVPEIDINKITQSKDLQKNKEII